MNKVVSGKSDLTGKVAMFEGFSGMFHQNRNLFCRCLQKTLARPILYKSCCFPTRICFKNIRGVTLCLSNRCFGGQKWRGKIDFEKNLFADFIVNF